MAGVRSKLLGSLLLAPLFVAAVLTPRGVVFAQQFAEFEVASVKENKNNGSVDPVPRRSGNLVIMHNTRLSMMLFYAYRLTADEQIEGYERFAEGWKWYDIEARTPDGATDDQVRLMIQSLLADRFKMKVHHETKEVRQFELVTDKGKPKLRLSTDMEPMKATVGGRTITQSAGICSGYFLGEGVHMVCHSAASSAIVAFVSYQLKNALVVDRTGLMGTYDVNMLFLPDEQTLDPNAPALTPFEKALQEELGLKLQKGKGPLDVLVIDHIEKPSEN